MALRTLFRLKACWPWSGAGEAGLGCMTRRGGGLAFLGVWLLTGRAAFAQSAAGGASAFVRSEFVLFGHVLLLLVLAAAGLALFGLGYLALRWAVRRAAAGGRFSPEKITAAGWILLPLVILAVITVPAIELIYHSDEPPYVTVSVTAHEWYWEYDYVSVPGLSFTSHVVPDNELKPGQVSGNAADHPLVLPAGKKVRFIVSSGDVLHGFFVPDLGVQIYAVPGALLNGWTIIRNPGVYFGHSSSICGNNHPPMPIEVRAVPLKDYQAWVKSALARAGGGF